MKDAASRHNKRLHAVRHAAYWPRGSKQKKKTQRREGVGDTVEDQSVAATIMLGPTAARITTADGVTFPVTAIGLRCEAPQHVIPLSHACKTLGAHGHLPPNHYTCANGCRGSWKTKAASLEPQRSTRVGSALRGWKPRRTEETVEYGDGRRGPHTGSEAKAGYTCRGRVRL